MYLSLICSIICVAQYLSKQLSIRVHKAVLPQFHLLMELARLQEGNDNIRNFSCNHRERLFRKKIVACSKRRRQ